MSKETNNGACDLGFPAEAPGVLFCKY